MERELLVTKVGQAVLIVLVGIVIGFALLHMVNTIEERYMILIRTVVMVGALVIFLYLGQRFSEVRSAGWWFLIIGFGFVILGSVADMLTALENAKDIFGDKGITWLLYVEKILGFLLGFVLLGYGFYFWIPSIVKARQTIRKYNIELEQTVSRRTEELIKLNQELRNREEALRISQRELQAKNRQLLEVNRLKSDFLSNMSHELRTPLSSIIGYASLMLDGEAPIGEENKFLEIIHRQGKSLLQLIGDLMDISMIESGTLELNLNWANLNDVVEKTLEVLRPTAQKSKIRLVAQLGTLPQTLVDEGRIQQVLWNLIGNALKFTLHDGKGLIAVTTRAVDNEIVVSVQDNGVGMEKEDLVLVFDRFRQADGSTRRKFEGVGLGLDLSKNLIELHGGRIWAESPGPGLGCTFAFVIPVEKSAVAAAAASQTTAVQPVAPKPRLPTSPKAPPPQIPAEEAPVESIPTVVPSSGRPRVLVVDDKEEILSLVSASLQKDFEVVQAHNGVEAIEQAKKSKPNVILMDLAMPVMDGFEAKEIIWRDVGRIPTLALTAIAMKGDRERILAQGFDGYVSKPFGPRELRDAIAHVSGKGKPDQQPT